jgi:hypothetical protein
MVINVKDLVTGCDTNAQGDVVRIAIQEALTSFNEIELSFSGFAGATTSFVNSAFLDLLDTMSFDEIKQRIRVTRSSRQINSLIKDSLTHAAEKMYHAA